MFKVGDIVNLQVNLHLNTNRFKDKSHRYRVGYIRELQGTIMLEDIDQEFSVEVLPKDIVLDVDYIRRKKLEKICSKLEIE